MTSPQRIEALSHILSDSIEGSIDYWAGIESIEKEDTPDDILGWRYKSAVIVDFEDGKKYTIDLGTVRKGINMLCKREGNRWDALRKYNKTNGYDGDYDAFDCDAIIQYALFGELVYA